MTSGISFLPPTRKPSVLHCQMEGHFVQSMDTTGPGSRFLLSVGGRSSTPPFVPLALPPPSFGGGGCCLGRGGELPSEEGSNFSCGRPGVPGLLWSPVSCPKGFGRFPPGLGPLLPQPVSQPGEVQNGDPVLYQGGHSAGRLGLQNRPSGRLLPHYDRPSAQEVPPLHPQRSSVPVFLPGLRPSPGTLALHQSSKRVCNGAEGQRRSIASILGRLGSSQSVGGHVSLPYVFDGGFSSGVGVFNQLGEVGPCSQTEVRLLGNEVRHPLFCGKPVRGQAVQTEQVPGLSPLCSLSFCSQTNFPSRDPGITVSSSPPGPPSQAPVSEGVQGKVVSSQGGLEPAGPVGQLVSLDHKNLEGPFLSRECGPDHSPQTGPDFVLGRLHPGLGGSPPGSHCIRSVEQRSALMAHKPLGTRGGFSGSPRVSSVSFGKTFVDSHRQHHGGVLHQQTGGGARSTSLSIRAEELLLFCQSHGIALSARHLAGKLNVLADALSRSNQVIHTEWTLSHRVLESVWCKFHKPMLDLFATRFSKRLPTYVSPVADPEALGVDALSLSWSGLEAYAFPPLPLIQKVVRKAREEHPCLLLVAPKWPAQPWFPELLELTVGDPFPLRLGPKDLLQPRSGIPHGNPGLLHLHVWHLCVEGFEH